MPFSASTTEPSRRSARVTAVPSFGTTGGATSRCALNASSGIRHPASSIQHPASGIRHPASGIRHPASRIPHLAPRTVNPTPRQKTTEIRLGQVPIVAVER
jgi:hypothetical protein